VVTVIDNREKAKAMGANGFHAKPVDRVWLMQHLENAVRNSSAQKVLLIDDDEVSRYLVRTVLAQHNFRIIEANNGQEGLQKANEENPDAIILDLAMPDLSGFEVLQKLKQSALTKEMPVIIHTSKVLDSQEQAQLSDAIAVISKESASRELLVERFTEAFRKAGIPNRKSITEEQHV
jgi:CheY-like chemotaxis protein